MLREGELPPPIVPQNMQDYEPVQRRGSFRERMLQNVEPKEDTRPALIRASEARKLGRVNETR